MTAQNFETDARTMAGRVTTVLLATLMLAACGQSGPLYLPGTPSQMQSPPAEADPGSTVRPGNEDDDDDDQQASQH